MSQVRVDALRGFHRLVRELHGDPDDLLAGVGIDPDVLTSSEGFVPYAAVTRVLEDAAAMLGCPDFGLRLCERQGIGILGPLAVAMQNSPTVGDAIACSGRYLHTHSPAIATSTRRTPDSDGILVVFEILLDHLGRAAQVTELSVGISARVLGLLTRDQRRPRSIRFPHEPVSSLDIYHEHFGVPVHFGDDWAAIEITESDLALPVRPADAALRELALDYLELRYTPPTMPLATRVRGVVRRSLGTGRVACPDVASALAMHPRTLQRRLNDEDTTFEALRDEVRRDLARRYLAQRDLSLGQIASLLEYSEQSAFTRSCRRWFGKPPKMVRNEL